MLLLAELLPSCYKKNTDKYYIWYFYNNNKSSCGIVVIAFIIKVEVQRFESVHGHFFSFFVIFSNKIQCDKLLFRFSLKKIILPSKGARTFIISVGLI